MIKENKTPLVSVIVPVYNVEKYLRRCLDSIIAQTFTDWECICVDDGSPDNSGAICDEYAQQDARFRVIHKENGGLSDTRNTGIKAAQGEYLLFLDSDDMLSTEHSFLAEAAAYIERTTLCLYYFTSIIETPAQHNWKSTFSCKSVSYTAFLRKHFYNTPFQAGWMFIVNRNWLISHGLFFVEGIFHEDEEWMPRILVTNRKDIGLISYPIYIYRTKRDGSIMNSINPRKLQDKKKICDGYVSIYEKETDVVKKQFIASKIAMMVSGIVLTNILYQAHGQVSRIYKFICFLRQLKYYPEIQDKKVYFLKSPFLRYKFLYFFL